MWTSHAIIGRDEELAALEVLLGRLAKGTGAAALVLGESGLGRTTFAREAMIRSRGLSAVGWSNVGATAKGARGVAMSLVAQIGEVRPEGAAAKLAAALGDAASDELLSSVIPALRAEASSGPVALFVDDVHLADQETCAFLDNLLAATREAPLLLLMTANSRDTGELAVWRRWSVLPDVSRVVLAPLADEAITRMLRCGHLGTPGVEDERAVQRITLAAQGAPRLAQSMRLWSAHAGGAAVGDLPTDDLVRRRIADCEYDGLLAALALCARPVPVELLAQAVGQREDLVSWVVDLAESSGVVLRVTGPSATGYEPTHPLLGAAAVARLDRERLDALRTGVAYAIADRENPEDGAWTPAEVAAHLIAAGDGTERALELCLRAAQWCELAQRYDDAVGFASYALRHSHRCAERGALLRTLGRCLVMAGSPGEAVQALREAVSVTDMFRQRGPYAQAVADLSAATPITADGRSERVAVLRRALGQCPTEEVVAEALLRALLAEAAYVPGVSGAKGFAECAAQATRALSLVTTHTADVPADAFVRSLVVNFHLAPPDWDKARAMIESTRALGTPLARMITLPAATALCLARGDMATLASLEAEHAALTGEEPRLPGLHGALRQLQATRALLAGQWDVLAPLLPRGENDVVESARHPELAAVISHVFACIWRSQTGRPTVAGSDPHDGSSQTSHALLTELRTLWAVTMPSQATADDSLPTPGRLADQFVRTALPPRDSAWSTRMVLRARLAAIAGDTVLARRVCAELAPFEDEFAVFSWCAPTGPVGWFTAEALLMLGRMEEARAANRSAEVASRRLGARFWTARCLIQRVLLFPQDDPQEMQAARDEALAIAEELDSICLFREAQELTTAPAGEPSRTSRLSSREREVLQLIGQGLRNNEIAGYLKVSVATVERQCTNMYRKLQVRNRSQALRVVGSW